MIFVDGKSAAMGEELYMQGILDAVSTLIGNGYRPGDIAFLVRTRAEGAAMSDYLISKGLRLPSGGHSFPGPYQG